MPMYTYKAVDNIGRTISGHMDAANISDLELRLRRLDLDLISGNTYSASRLRALAGAGIRRQELITFCFHLEQLTRAGVPLIEGLMDLRDSVSNLRFREIVANLIENIEGGMQLSQALAVHPKVFDKVFVSLVKAGEQTGKLPEIFQKLTESLKWQDEIAAQTKKLIMYPAFVGTVVVGVTFFLMIYLVPQLVKFIQGMNRELPFHTKMLISVSSFFTHYWYLILAAPIITWVLVTYLARTNPAFRYRLDELKLRIWLVGPILNKIILARFANFFALMYASGISVIDSIRTCEEIADNQVISQGLRRVGQSITEGQGVSASFNSIGLFPPLVLRMLRVGETTGALDSALLNVSYFYDREVKEGIARIQTMIEPVMTVVLGVILGWVMLSVIGPIYDTISKIKI